MGLEPKHASLRGPGWRDRNGTHTEDVRSGKGWARCGVESEVDALQAVLLAWPGKALAECDRPEDFLFRESVHVGTMQAQAQAVADAFRRHGVTVHFDVPGAAHLPNYVFMRDLFFMTPEGALLARMASEQRTGEERHAAAALATLGIPILASPRGGMLFEGADALWLGTRDVIVGVGNRTNVAGCAWLAGILGEFGVRVHRIRAPAAAQHLLGCVNFVDDRLAVVLTGVAPPELVLLLEEHGVSRIDLSLDDESRDGRAMNFVTLSRKTVLMPARCPHARAIFESHGVRCSEVEISEFLKADGGLGCLTGVLWRNEPSARGDGARVP
jgi:N-dimethylarginine dimethylaminohydrolase